jgi:hypothetical protein
MYCRLLQRDKQFRSEFGDLHNAAICHRACSKNIAAVKRDSQYGLIRICNGIFVDDCRTLTQNAPIERRGREERFVGCRRFRDHRLSFVVAARSTTAIPMKVQALRGSAGTKSKSTVKVEGDTITLTSSLSYPGCPRGIRVFFLVCRRLTTLVIKCSTGET